MNTINCDSDTLSMYYYTILYLRYLAPCSINLSNDNPMTDLEGFGYFNNLVITKASEGAYL